MRNIRSNNFNKFIVKILMICVGVTCVGCGIAFFYALNIGSDPISVFVDGQHRIFGLSYGTVNLLNSILYLIFIFLFRRDLIRLATLISGVALGPLINLFTGLLGNYITPKGSLTLQLIWGEGIVFIPPDSDYLIRLLLLVPAVILLGFGLGLYLSANMGASPVDAVVIFISDKSAKPLKKAKVAFDLTVAILGFVLGGVTGVGTVIGILLTGPTIAYSLQLLGQLRRRALLN